MTAVLALGTALLALIVACTALALVIMGAARNVRRDPDDLPASTFLLTADQREAMAPEVQARIFHEETLARIAKRR